MCCMQHQQKGLTGPQPGEGSWCTAVRMQVGTRVLRCVLWGRSSVLLVPCSCGGCPYCHLVASKGLGVCTDFSKASSTQHWTWLDRQNQVVCPGVRVGWAGQWPDRHPLAPGSALKLLLASSRPADLFPVPQESNCSRPQLLRVCPHGVFSQGPQHPGHALELDLQPPPVKLLQSESRLFHPAARGLSLIQRCTS